GPHLIRCGLKAEVIGLQVYSAALRFVQKNRQTQGARLAFAEAPKQKFLRDATVENRVHQQNIAPLQFGTRAAEKNLTSRMLALLHIADLLANKVTNQRRSNLANQIRSKNKTAVHGDHHIQAATFV